MVDLPNPAEPTLCATVISRAVEVEVRDARTGEPAADAVTATARSGDFVETLRVIGWTSHPSPRSAVMIGGVDERPGVYTVRIEKDGYRTWERSGVVAEQGPCGVLTARLDAQLEPVP